MSCILAKVDILLGNAAKAKKTEMEAKTNIDDLVKEMVNEDLKNL